MKNEYQLYLEAFKKKKAEYKGFIKNLRARPPKNLDGFFAEAEDEGFTYFNCADCANCCRGLGPLMKDRDVKPLSSSLGMTPIAFSEKYLRRDEEGDLVMKSLPCPFLQSDSLCLVYDDRPGACREYPSLKRRKQIARLDFLLLDADVCPIVVYALKKLKAAFEAGKVD